MFTGKSTTTISVMFEKLIQFFFLCLYVWPQYAHARDITWIPRSEKEYLDETQNVTCPLDEKPIYTNLRTNGVNKTVITCDKDGLINGQYCVENNTRGVQPDFTADCSKFSPPCNDPYLKSESYKFPECFERYGGILSPKDQEERYEKLLQNTTKEHQRLTRQIEDLKGRLQNEQKVKTHLEENVRKMEKELESSKEAKTVTTLISSIMSILAIYILIIVFLVKKYYYKTQITYKKFLIDRLFVNGPGILQEPDEILLRSYTKIEDRKDQNSSVEDESTSEQDSFSKLKDESPNKNTADNDSSVVPEEIDLRSSPSNIFNNSNVDLRL